MKLTLKTTVDVPVAYLQAECGVRYWEDAKVNGVEDTEGTLIPCRVGDNWAPLIDLETGKILNWTPGVIADIHYKVCDAGVYTLLDANKTPVISIEGYVPTCCRPNTAVSETTSSWTLMRTA